MASPLVIGSSMGGLRPNTGGVMFTPRDILKTSNGLRTPGSRASRGSFEYGRLEERAPSRASSAPLSPVALTPNPQLSIIEVEQLIRDKVRQHYHDLKQACQNYDIDQSLTITKGELRRVLDTYCHPLTREQFDAVVAKVPANASGTIVYCNFLDRFASSGEGSRESWKMTSGHRYSYTKSPQDMGIDVLERQLREKVAGNLKNFIKGLHLFDYNRDGKVQKHEMRKVIENYCFRMTDEQYDRLWSRYDFHHNGVVNYREFLQRLGVNVKRHDIMFPESTKPLSFAEKEQNRHKQVEQLAVFNGSDDTVRGMTFPQIEAELRKRLKENYINLKKMFMAFDARQDGFVSLEDLKSILIQFTLPMSDQLFLQLMDRFGLKASHKIPWEHFLEKFQNPRIEGNGQTIPIKPNHKVNPIREGDSEMEVEDIARLLHKHVTNMYPSIKEAFLAFDQNRDGKVTKKELRKILDKFTIRLNEQQFKGLVAQLDPYNDNCIDYHTFLDLFEVRETKEGHKWLDSEHRWNDRAPANLAWSTVEDILREKIEEYWKSVSSAYRLADPEGTGAIGYKPLKRILNRHVLPVSDEHFDVLWSQCEESPDGKIIFGEFLAKLGVDVSPGDLVGPSTRIQVLSDLSEQQRQADLDIRLTNVQQTALERTSQLSADEVIVKLKDRMAQKSGRIRDNFLRYCKSRRGKLYKKEFRQVLKSFGMYMEDDQFSSLCEIVGFNRGPLTYTDFVEQFEDPRARGPGDEITRVPNHRYTHLLTQSMTSGEVEGLLLDKMRQAFGSLRTTFYKLDDNHDGLVEQEDFRRLMDTLMFTISDEEFKKLMSKLGINKRTKLSYRDFLDRFQVVDAPGSHKWLDSDHRFNKTHDPAQLAADQVHDILVTKAQRTYQDLAKAFMTIDKNGNGVITKKELRDLLYTFMLPMTKDEFELLWKKYDFDCKGYIDHQHFLYMMGKSFAPGDEIGVSRRIVEDSHETLENHHITQLNKQMNITINQASNATFIPADQLEQALKDRFRDKYASFQNAFNQLDLSKTGYVTVKELQKVLLDHNYLVDDSTFSEFLQRIGVQSVKGKLSYVQFLEAFDEGREARYRQKNHPVVRPESFSLLGPDKALKKLKRLMSTQLPVLKSAFGAFDKDKRGRISAPELRRVLDNFCFKLTDKQFKHLMTKIRVNSDLTVSYMAFLEEFSTNENEIANSWFESLNKVDEETTRQSPPLYTLEDLQKDIRMAVTARFYRFTEKFGEVDYAKIGVVSKEDFKMVMDEIAFRMNPDQLDSLWNTLPVNEFGNMEYHKFLKQYTVDNLDVSKLDSLSELPRASSVHPARQIATSPAVRASSRLSSRMSIQRLATPLVNAENAEQRLKLQMGKQWKEVQRLCRLKDPESSGEVDGEDFRGILESLGFSLTGDEFDQLTTKYDLKGNGKFCYLDFLKHSVLKLQPVAEEGEDRPSMSRHRIHPSKIPTKPGSSSSDMIQAMLRVRECIIDNWKQMRRAFRGIDPSGTGIVTAMQFRSVLRQFNINMSEDEFFHLMTYYDRCLEGKISYNDFLRAFLQ
ncbi:EF-hand calcium-binding domain-containing protein 6-like [Asterias amurensis]|uniref:EF-hand calcium-binding domain-containing protein 6-like n=1 Tax=Asterias amurensis TaxID=7602 RepID=UPI003AB424DF